MYACAYRTRNAVKSEQEERRRLSRLKRTESARNLCSGCDQLLREKLEPLLLAIVFLVLRLQEYVGGKQGPSIMVSDF